MPLDDFLDLEELGIVARDRKAAWDLWLSRNPDVFRGQVPHTDS